MNVDGLLGIDGEDHRGIYENFLSIRSACGDRVISLDLPFARCNGHGVRLPGDRIGDHVLEERNDPVQAGLQDLLAVAFGGHGRNHHPALGGLDENQPGADAGPHNCQDSQYQDGSGDRTYSQAARCAHNGQDNQSDYPQPD